MLCERSVSGLRGLLAWSVGLAVLGGVAATVRADEPAFLLPSGERVPMVQSDTELLLEFVDAAEAPNGAGRLIARGLGTVEEVRHIKPTRYRMLIGNTASIERRREIRQDAGIVAARPVYRFAGSDTPVMSSGTIVLRVRPELDAAERDALFTAYRVRVVKFEEALPDVYVVAPTWADADEIRRAEALATDHRTLWAQPNLLRPLHTRQVVPTDEFFSAQWHLNNTGQDGGTPDADIDATEAWVISEGADIRFAIFDDGFDLDHEDLRDNYSGIGHDASRDTNQAGSNDPTPKGFGDRHGTAVLGLALARANEVGVRGVSYLSQFAATAGLGELMSDFQIAGVYTFARQDNVDVHINSWGSPGPNSAAVESALETAYREGRDLDGEGGDPPRGIVVVFASGNEGIENVAGTDYSTVPWVIGVGMSTNRDERSNDSNYGTNVNLLAPGAGMLATTDVEDDAGYVTEGYNEGGIYTYEFGGSSPDLDEAGSYTKFFAGTSAACPIVAGTAGLMLATAPNLTALDVRLILEHTVDEINAGAADYDGITSRSEKYGYGRINAHSAVLAAQDSLTNGNRSWPQAPKNVRNVVTQLVHAG